MNNELDSTYTGEIVFSDFHGTEIITLPRSGGMIKGIFIPLSINGLYCDSKGRTTGYFYIKPKRENIYKQTHMIQMKISKKRNEEMERLGYKPPIIGNFRKIEKKKVTLDIDEILKR